MGLFSGKNIYEEFDKKYEKFPREIREKVYQIVRYMDENKRKKFLEILIDDKVYKFVEDIKNNKELLQDFLFMLEHYLGDKIIKEIVDLSNKLPDVNGKRAFIKLVLISLFHKSNRGIVEKVIRDMKKNINDKQKILKVLSTARVELIGHPKDPNSYAKILKEIEAFLSYSK